MMPFRVRHTAHSKDREGECETLVDAYRLSCIAYPGQGEWTSPSIEEFIDNDWAFVSRAEAMRRLDLHERKVTP